MKGLFGFAFFLLFLAGFALVLLMGRETSPKVADGGSADLTGIHWQPVSVGDMNIARDTRMFVSFAVDGSVKGHGGCNGFFGSFEQTETGLALGPLGATRMACPEPIMGQETRFLEMLQVARQFESNGGRLRLQDDEGNVLAEFVAVEK